MAVMNISFLSKELGIQTKVNVILPIGRAPAEEKRPRVLYQTLWLLHGGTDDSNSFIYNTNIVRYAEENQIAVVIPEDDDAFYTDGYIANGGRYFSYVTEELPKMCRSILPLSPRREDNFVGGNSMGGGGAMKCAMLHPELYKEALIMSSGGIRMHRAEDAWVAGFLSDVMNGRDLSAYDFSGDPKEDVQMALPIYKILKEGKADLPAFHFTCGSDDGILPQVQAALCFYEKMGLRFTYREYPGYRHEWALWDRVLAESLREVLPLRHAPVPAEETE